MKLFRFDASAGRHITQYGSDFTMTPLARPEGDVRIGCMYLDAGNVVGYHQATTPQLFLVVAGEGWVRGPEEERQTIHAGQAAFWSGGEWHAAGTDTGMTAVVVEADTLDPAALLTPLDQ